MSVKMLGRFGVLLFLIALASGCVSKPSTGKWPSSNECAWDPNRCMYEGPYELGEREYAEEEAKKLNRKAARKLRQRSVWGW